MDSVEVIGRRIYDLRTAMGETQEQAAEMIGISHVALARYENGQRMPKLDILASIARHYSVSVDELIGHQADNESQSNLEGRPQTTQARIISGGVDKMPEDKRKQALELFELMFAKYFKEE